MDLPANNDFNWQLNETSALPDHNAHNDFFATAVPTGDQFSMPIGEDGGFATQFAPAESTSNEPGPLHPAQSQANTSALEHAASDDMLTTSFPSMDPNLAPRQQQATQHLQNYEGAQYGPVYPAQQQHHPPAYSGVGMPAPDLPISPAEQVYTMSSPEEMATSQNHHNDMSAWLASSSHHSNHDDHFPNPSHRPQLHIATHQPYHNAASSLAVSPTEISPHSHAHPRSLLNHHHHHHHHQHPSSGHHPQQQLPYHNNAFLRTLHPFTQSPQEYGTQSAHREGSTRLSGAQLYTSDNGGVLPVTNTPIGYGPVHTGISSDNPPVGYFPQGHVVSASSLTNSDQSSFSSRKKSSREEPMDEEEKRKVFLERNRAAAAKCRKKKKEADDDTQRKRTLAEEHNKGLKEEREALQGEFMRLKNALLAHMSEGCDAEDLRETMLEKKSRQRLSQLLKDWTDTDEINAVRDKLTGSSKLEPLAGKKRSFTEAEGVEEEEEDEDLDEEDDEDDLDYAG